MRARYWIWLICLGLGGLSAFQLQATEVLGTDGFPADYQPVDYAPDDGVSRTVPVSGTQPDRTVQAAANDAIKPVGTRFRIDQLPRTGSSTLPSEIITAVPESLPQPVRVTPDASQWPSTLAGVEAWGPLTTESGGFGRDVWQNIDRNSVDTLLAGLRQRPPQMLALQDVLVRLMLTAAVPPEQKSGGETAMPWLMRRAEMLRALGQDEAAWQLWRAVPATVRETQPELAKGWVEHALVAGESRAACAEARRQILASGNSGAKATRAVLFWPQAVAVCQLLENQLDGARLSWQLAQEKVPTDQKDAMLGGIIQAWLQKQPLPEGLERHVKGMEIPTLSAALLVAKPELMNGPTAEGIVDRLPQVALRRLMNTAHLPVLLRLRAAERLAASGRLNVDGQAVALLYQAVPFETAERRDPVGQATQLRDAVKARALLWQVASNQGQDNRSQGAPTSLRALSWERWQQRARQDGLGEMVGLMMPELANLRADSTLMWLTPVVLNESWRQGNGSRGVPWLVTTANTSGTLPPAMKRLLPSWQLVNRILGGDRKMKVEDWSTWLQARQDQREAKGDDDSGRVLAAAEQLGVSVPVNVWTNLLNPAVAQAPEAAPNPVWKGAVQAALQRHLSVKTNERQGAGLTVLLLSQMQAGEDPAAQGWLETRMAALQAVGLPDAARQLAGTALAARLVPTEDMAPALPRINGGVAPTTRGVEIGGKALPEVRTEDLSPAAGEDDGLMLPPPRVSEAPRRKFAKTSAAKTAIVAPQVPAVAKPLAPVKPGIRPLQ